MHTLPSGLPDYVDNQEDLARFLTQSSLFSAGRAKPAAFLPNPKDRETSVSRHGMQPLDDLWSLGRVAARDRNLYGAAFFTAASVRAAQLEVTADEPPPPRHAVIRGWPWLENDPALQKAQQKERALVIACAAELLLR